MCAIYGCPLMRNIVNKMTNKSNSLVMDLNRSYGWCSDLSQSKLIEKPFQYSQKKTEIITGYTQYSVNSENTYHGFFREVKGEHVSKMGLLLHGKPYGPVWQRVEGDAFIVTHGQYMTYLYPNMTSAIHGEL